MGGISRIAVISIIALHCVCIDGANAEEPRSQLLSVTVTHAKVAEIPVLYSVPGSIISDGRINVSSRVVGFIEQLDVREGQTVSRGDLLVRIDQTDIDEAIRQSQSSVIVTEKDLGDAEKDVQKYNSLVTTGAVASETLRKAKVRVDIARSTIDKARSALAAAEAQKGYATIVSPVDGVIVSVARRSGEMATAGATLLTVESHETLLFKAFVSESNLAAIDPGRAVTVRFDTLRDKAFEGPIRGIVPSGDDTTRSYEINVILPKNPRLLPGMFGRAEIVLGNQQVVVIPRNVLVRRGGLDGVFVVERGLAHFRWLRTGRILGENIEIVSGLHDGETVLVAATADVRDLSPVQIVENSQ